MPSPRSTCILQVVVLLASLTTPAPVLRAQIGATRFQHLTIAEGLSQNSVNAILQDRYGFLWFGTQDGLDRYDGRTFIGHRNSDRANSLSNNYIWALHEDDDGMIWIGTFGGGLDRYDPRTGTFTHHRHDPVDTTTIPSDRVFSIVQDAQGTLWLGTNNGLGALDPSTGKVRRYLVNGTTDRESRDHYVTALALQGDGLWMRTDSGLSHLNIRSGRITHHDLLPFSGKERLGDVLSVTVRNDDLYVTCGAGLVHINTALRTDSILLAPAAIPEIGPKASFTRLWIDGNNWWIGSTR
ncbi:MAG: hypothetical protein KDB84_04710, partial [Flavobacteriales bacterium]|nr:hypothetical protein [Flavobacteriales bacterium]